MQIAVVANRLPKYWINFLLKSTALHYSASGPQNLGDSGRRRWNAMWKICILCKKMWKMWKLLWKTIISLPWWSEGEKIQKRVYISSGKFPTFLKVPTFVWFSDTHFDNYIYQNLIPKLNLLSTYQFAAADACCMSSLSQYCPQENFGWTELQAAKWIHLWYCKTHSILQQKTLVIVKLLASQKTHTHYKQWLITSHSSTSEWYCS
jgi:hypothetical protein